MVASYLTLARAGAMVQARSRELGRGLKCVAGAGGMKISVVTVSYHAAETIEDTMRSVAEQTHPDVEHIVVDGGSNDGTMAIVKQRLRAGGKAISEPDDGLYDAMNKGISLATGDVVGLLNSDDFYASPTVLAHVAGAFESSNVDAVLGDVAYFRGSDPSRTIRRYDSGLFSPRRIGWGWMPAHPAMFLTREAYERVGPYRTDYRIAADFEFVARAFGKQGLSYVHLPEIIVKMRAGGISTAGGGAKLTINREVLRACRENGIRSNALMIASKYPAKLLGYLK